jgi:phage shock protein A
VQDQLQTVKRLLATQQADTKRLSEQVTTLNESIDGLRQSFASARATEAETPSVTRRKPVRHRVHASSARKRSRG